MNKEQEQKRQRLINEIKNFRLMDDNFMTKFFEDDLECTSIMLQIILGNPKLRVIESISQYSIKNLYGRSVRLDVKATDDTGKIYDIEVQRADKGAGAKRARYNCSLIDANILKKREDTSALTEVYVIFITENDVLGDNRALYHIDRVIKENGKPFDDGMHIIYVNGKYRDNTPIGYLMHDFNCINPKDMKIKAFAKKASVLKETEQGVNNMCRAIEQIIEEEKAEVKAETKEAIIIEMLKKNYTIADIAEITKLSVDQIKEIAQKNKTASS